MLGLAWMVKDWRNDQLIVRHAYQFANKAENVKAYYSAHDGENYAQEVIIDEEYNAKFLITFLQEAADSEDTIKLSWKV